MPSVVSLDRGAFRSLVTGFQLPLLRLDTSSAVGPFFWWDQCGDNPRGCMHFPGALFAPMLCIVDICAYSHFWHRDNVSQTDVGWRGTSQGFELMLSYSDHNN